MEFGCCIQLKREKVSHSEYVKRHEQGIRSVILLGSYYLWECQRFISGESEML